MLGFQVDINLDETRLCCWQGWMRCPADGQEELAGGSCVRDLLEKQRPVVERLCEGPQCHGVLALACLLVATRHGIHDHVLAIRLDALHIGVTLLLHVIWAQLAMQVQILVFIWHSGPVWAAAVLADHAKAFPHMRFHAVGFDHHWHALLGLWTGQVHHKARHAPLRLPRTFEKNTSGIRTYVYAWICYVCQSTTPQPQWKSQSSCAAETGGQLL